MSETSKPKEIDRSVYHTTIDGMSYEYMRSLFALTGTSIDDERSVALLDMFREPDYETAYAMALIEDVHRFRERIAREIKEHMQDSEEGSYEYSVNGGTIFPTLDFYDAVKDRHQPDKKSTRQQIKRTALSIINAAMQHAALSGLKKISTADIANHASIIESEMAVGAGEICKLQVTSGF
jgi:hypothetical protein